MPSELSNDVDLQTLDRLRVLWEENRLTCGWFVRDDFVPQTRGDMVRCLGWLKRYGMRATYVAARKLEKCL